MDYPEAASRLIALLEQGGDATDLEPLAYALSHFQHESAIAILRLASWSSNERVMKSSIAALGFINTPDALKALFDVMDSGQGKDRGAVGRAVALKSAAEHPDEKLVSTYEREVALGRNVLGVDTAIDCLVLIPSKEAFRALERQSMNARDPQVRTRAQIGLGRHKSRWNVPLDQ
jgi:HEAT repeat protein